MATVPLTGGQLSAAVSNHVVQTLLHRTGRGPTEARAVVDRDVITVVYRDMLTEPERMLVAQGDTELVLQVRRRIQETMRADLEIGVSEMTGRAVLCFMSANNVDPDMGVEVFVLAPDGNSGSVFGD